MPRMSRVARLRTSGRACITSKASMPSSGASMPSCRRPTRSLPLLQPRPRTARTVPPSLPSAVFISFFLRFFRNACLVLYSIRIWPVSRNGIQEEFLEGQVLAFCGVVCIPYLRTHVVGTFDPVHSWCVLVTRRREGPFYQVGKPVKCSTSTWPGRQHLPRKSRVLRNILTMDSFDYFVEHDLRNIVNTDSRTNPEPNSKFSLVFSNLYIGVRGNTTTTMTTAWLITPQECRVRSA